MSEGLALHIGESKTDTSPRRITTNVDGLFRALAEPRGSAKNGRYVQLVEYADGARRDLDHVVAVHGYVADLDSGDWDADDIRDAMDGIRCYVYATFSSTPDAKRWRCVVPFDRPVDRSVFEAIHKHFFTPKFEPDLDAKSGGAAQLWFTRRRPRKGSHDEAFEIEGELFDTSGFLELAEAPPKPRASLNGEKPDHPVFRALDEAGLVLRRGGKPGMWLITCPWEHEHTSGQDGDGSTVYFEPHHGGYEGEGFRCQHAHCDQRRLADVRERLHAGHPRDDVLVSGDGLRLHYDTLTQSHNADRFLAAHGDRYRWTPEIDWIHWDGTRWCPDSLLAAHADAEAVIRGLLREASGLNEQDVLKKATAFIQKSLAAPQIRGMLDLAQARREVADTLTRYDDDDWLLNTSTGVVDLRTGKLMPHEATRRISKITGAGYRPGAPCSRWEQFVLWAMGSDIEMVQFLRRLLGSALVGGNHDQRVAFAFGLGANGKTVLFECVADVLGDYAATASREQFVITTNPGAKDYGLARLMGVRLLQVAETGEGRRFDEEALKDFSGGDVVSARHPYGRPFEYHPKASVFIRGNHKPRVSGQDLGFWRRMLLIPFEATVAEADRDGDLAGKLLAERDGILRWLVDGALEWQRDGLQVPDVVRRATAEYRDDEFELGEFVAEACETGKGVTGAASAIYSAYKRWCEDRMDRPMSAQKFGRVLGQRFHKRHANTGTVYEGLKQRPIG